MLRTTLCSASLGAFILLSPFAHAQCDDWHAGPLKGTIGIASPVLAVVPWDPNPSLPGAPQLVIAGKFRVAGATTVNSIACWDGSGWLPFGLGVSRNGFPAAIDSLGVFPPSMPALNGQLFAAGEFTSAGGEFCNHIARWDGLAWHDVGGGVNDEIHATIIMDPDGPGPLGVQLIAGGYFDMAGATAATCIARFDGASWHALGTGMSGNGGIEALAAADPNNTGHPQLFAAGGFQKIGSLTANGIARWNGATWSPLSTGMSSNASSFYLVQAIATIPSGMYAGQLVAGGKFDRAGNVSCQNLARWDGASWHPFGSGATDSVRAMTLWDYDGKSATPSQLVISGHFGAIDGVPLSGVARWDGASWQPLGPGINHDAVALTTWDHDDFNATPPHLVVGGGFTRAGALEVNNIASTDGSNWFPFTQTSGASKLYAITRYRESMVAAGDFTFGTFGPKNLVSWDGIEPAAVDSGLNAPGRALKYYTSGAFPDHHLIVGGDFTAADNTPAKYIARRTESFSFFDSGWFPLGPGLNNTVHALERFNNFTIAGGTFTATGDNITPLNHLARFDGTNWVGIGPGATKGVDGTVRALKSYSVNFNFIALAVGGDFQNAGGSPASRIALYTQNVLTGASSWSALGAGFNAPVRALERFNNNTYAAGDFTSSGLTPLNRVAMWNGTNWTQVGLGFNAPVRALLVENGVLYAAGDFTASGFTPLNHVARWDGSAWLDVRGGTDQVVHALSAFHNEVHAGGEFSSIKNSTITSPGWARFFETGTPWIARQPASVITCQGAETSLNLAVAQGYDNLSYSWRRNAVPLSDGTTPWGTVISGAASATLDLSTLHRSDAGTYDCLITNSCGTVTSTPAILNICLADFTCDTVVDDSDFLVFILAYNDLLCPNPPAICAADLNNDGFVDDGDFTLFVVAYNQLVCS